MSASQGSVLERQAAFGVAPAITGSVTELDEMLLVAWWIGVVERKCLNLFLS